MADSRELATYRLARAQESLDEANLMMEAEHWNAAVNRLYYACFYAVSAVLVLRGHSSRRHTGTRDLFNKYVVKPGHISTDLARFYGRLFNYRHQSDYEDFLVFDPELVQEYSVHAKQLVMRLTELADSSKE